jgi:hypothetical protein
MNTSVLTRMLAILVALPSVLTSGDFDDWPTGASPVEVGNRVTENFLVRPHMMMGRDDVIHYAEVCTWLGGLSFAQASGNKELGARFVSGSSHCGAKSAT